MTENKRLEHAAAIMIWLFFAIVCGLAVGWAAYKEWPKGSSGTITSTISSGSFTTGE